MAKGNRGRSTDDSELPKAKLSKQNFKKSFRLFSYMKEVRGKFALGIIFLVGTAIVGLLFPLLGGSMIGNIANTSTDIPAKLAELKKSAVPLFAVLALQALFSFGRVYFFTQASESLLKQLRLAVYSKLISKPMTFFNQHQTTELSSRMATDIGVVGDTFTLTLAEFVRQTIVGLGGLVLMMYYTNPKIALWFLVIIPPLIIISLLFARKIRGFSRQYQDKISHSQTIAGDSLIGIVNVKTFTNEQFEVNRYSKAVDAVRSFGIKYGVYRGLFFAFVISCVFGSVFFILYKMLVLNATEQMNGESFGRFLMLALFVSGSLGGLAETIASIQKALGATERLFEWIDGDVEQINSTTEATEKVKGELQLRDINFHYPMRTDVEVLRGLSFTAEAGSTVAIVGSSGSGKSTIANLLLRFYDCNQGQILLDGKNIIDMPLHFLRQQIAYVPQEILLFAGSIADNIAYGKTDATKEEIKEAARQANALNFIESFPEGLDTKVGERGLQLSGGQRQRIAIARAVLKNPAILILDEATSSLDSESEKLVQEALDKLMQNRTSIVIAHRLSTIRDAQKIVVISKGVITEQGTHAELMLKEDGFYRKMTQLQLELQ